MEQFRYYRTKYEKTHGTNLSEVYKIAHRIYRDVTHKTKRKPYIRSAYFKKQKVFLNVFWQHLQTKNPRDRFQRLKFFACALDLMKNSTCAPESKDNPNNPEELVHRFYGLTRNKEVFYVQIKEDKRTGSKYFLSVFPERK